MFRQSVFSNLCMIVLSPKTIILHGSRLPLGWKGTGMVLSQERMDVTDIFGECKRRYQLSHQVDVVKDECGFVHLAQDQQHLIVDELFVLFQVTVHVLFQLCTDLTREIDILYIYIFINSPLFIYLFYVFYLFQSVLLFFFSLIILNIPCLCF